VANTSYELTFAIASIILAIFIKIKKEKLEILKQKDKMISAICETCGQFTYVYAMSGNGAVSAPIISAVCVVSVILSRIFLKEKLTKRQYVFITLVILGIITITAVEGD
jgi:drug/metabolite transporter (DMT)-like permease